MKEDDEEVALILANNELDLNLIKKRQKRHGSIYPMRYAG